ncbi:MAG TPA: lycopene cyclase domain-containing protein [Candidatus Saccharimonadia bacterium]
MIWQFGYITALICAILCMLWLDRRWRLVWWQDWRRAARAIGVGWIFFVLADLAGMKFELFYPGPSPFTTHVMIWPGLPLEEYIFLWFLAYQPLIIWEGYRRWKRG